MKYFTVLLFFYSCVCSGQTKYTGWTAQSVREGEVMLDVSKIKSEFQISVKDKKFKGSIGCNSFTGFFTTTEDPGRLEVNRVNSKAGCPERLSKEELLIYESVSVTDKILLKEQTAEFYNAERLVLILDRN